LLIRQYQAARKAGIHDIDLIKEPEAAALYTLHDLKDKALKVGGPLITVYIMIFLLAHHLLGQ
jgi:molecular chaperone DnaK (HSP70)